MMLRPRPFARLHPLPAVLALLLLASLPGDAFGQLRLVAWNTEDNPTQDGDADFQTVLSAIDQSDRAGFARPIDMLMLSEQRGGRDASARKIAAIMNDLHDTDAYRWFQDGSPGSSGGIFDDKVAYVWNSDTIANLDLDTLDTPGPRPLFRGQWRPVGYDSEDASFHTYAVHFKAGGSGRDEQIRGQEAAALRADADQRPPGTNFIFGGDFNLSDAQEAAFQTITAPGIGQGIDPRGGSFSKSTHTQNSRFSLTRRLDFQFVSEALVDQQGLNIIPGSYHAFANNGTHTTGQPITTGSGASPEVLQALVNASDHLPVVADFRLPARMDASVRLADADPSAESNRIIADTPFALAVEVRNTAPVQVAAGAETLSYTVAGASPNVVSGTVFGSADALAGPNTHTVIALSGQPGARSATVRIASNNVGLNDASLDRELAWTSLAHADPSFDDTQTTRASTVHFGTVTADTGPAAAEFSLFNRESAPGFTADLHVLGVEPISGDADRFSLPDLPAVLAAGDAWDGAAALRTDAPGMWEAVYRIEVSDEPLIGAATYQLDLTLTGEVLPAFIPGDLTGDGAVDGLDIDPFVQLLTGGGFDPAADLNGDGAIDGLDIDPFVQQLTGAQQQAIPVPEPTTLMWLALAGSVRIARRGG